MEPLISIIVPVFNNTKFIDECIRSLRNQTYSNLEVLLIDDGSDVNIGKLYDNYARGGVKVIHKPNGGVSSARNLGIAQARGEFICFVDSDDYVAPRYIETLYSAIVKYKVEIAACAYSRVASDWIYKEEQPSAIEDGKEYYILADNKWENIYDNCHSAEGFLWNKIFSRRSIQGLLFNESLKMSEDMLFTFQAIERVTDIVVVDIPLYYYRFNQESVTANINKEIYEQKIMVAKMINDIVKKNSDSKTALKYNHMIFDARFQYSKWLIYNRINNSNWVDEIKSQRKLWLCEVNSENQSGKLSKEIKLYSKSEKLFLIYFIVRSKLSFLKRKLDDAFSRRLHIKTRER